MKNLLIVIAISTFFSCSNTDEIDELNFTLIAGLEFSIFNAQNEDLLNPGNPNHLNTDDIRLFYVINGESQEFFKGNLDNPRGYLIGEHEGIYRIGIYLNHAETEDRPITYIQWNNNIETDTIEVSYRKIQHAVIQETIWLNGEQIWEIGDNTSDPYFVLEK
ncbi:hypothetical protein ACFSKL_04380 [Belliella marina]|uniref:Uncharacterized protein n=1 Tax=Belliella marina TaxID=1644146 RepID=A0ABW4VJJ5_9BACT